MIETAPDQERFTPGMTQAERIGVIQRNRIRASVYANLLDREYGPPRSIDDWLPDSWPLLAADWRAKAMRAPEPDAP